MTRVSVVELDCGGVELVVEDGRLVAAFDLSCDEAIRLGRQLLDGGELEGTHKAAGGDAAPTSQGALGGAERGPQRLSEPLSDLLADLHQQNTAGGSGT